MGLWRLAELAKNKTLGVSDLVMPGLFSFRKMQAIQALAMFKMRCLPAPGFELKQHTWT